MRIAVVGLGKLGAPLAGMLAKTGARVTGADRDAHVISQLRVGDVSTLEPGLKLLLASVGSNLTYTTDAAEAVANADTTFILVPTPSTNTGEFSNASLLSVIAEIGPVVARKPDYHLIVIVSTVMPGTMELVITPALEQAVGRSVGEDLGLCYCPEFVALGSVIHGMEHPELVLIGQSDEAAGNRLVSILRPVWACEPSIRQLNFINAELTKLAVNSFVTTKISYANMLSELCDKMPGADAQIITSAIGCDSRIAPGYLTPGLGFAGPCFPRDNRALVTLACRLGQSADIAAATDRINGRQTARIVAMISRLAPQGTIGVLGLAYKPGSDVCEASQGLEIALELAHRGHRVLAHDPSAKIDLPHVIERRDDVDDCVRACDLVVIATPWPEYARISHAAMSRDGRRLIVVDCWRIPELRAAADLVELVYPGSG